MATSFGRLNGLYSAQTARDFWHTPIIYRLHSIWLFLLIPSKAFSERTCHLSALDLSNVILLVRGFSKTAIAHFSYSKLSLL